MNKTSNKKEYMNNYMKEYTKKPESIEYRRKYMKEYMKKITNYCKDCDVYCSKYDKHYKTIEHINNTRYTVFNIKKGDIILEFD